MNNLSAVAELSVELAETGIKNQSQIPLPLQFCENYHVSSGGWKRVASIEIIESRF
jgi:hypothetical protein